MMAEEGINSFHLARKKAALRLGVGDSRCLPDNREIESSLIEYQRLFQRDSQAQHLRVLRSTALKTMQLLGAFSPRLVGPVLSGCAGKNSIVTLHLFVDTPEEIDLMLIDNGIPYVTAERQERPQADKTRMYPSYKFMLGEVTVELVVFEAKDIRQAPLSPVDNRPVERADPASVKSLLSADTAPQIPTSQ